MKLVTTEAVMTALCQHCDSHIEMCEECGMREIIESVPSAWISVKDRLPEPGLRVLATDGNFVGESYISTAGNWYRYGTPWTVAWKDWSKDKTTVTHWMPLPDAPEVEGCGSD